MAFHYISILNAWNTRIVPWLGFPLNTLLIWMIWTKTPKEMRVHSRILLQTCILDSIFLLVNVIATPDIYLAKMSFALFGNDPIFLVFLGSTLFILFLFDFYGISVQFFYRYLQLNWNVSFNIPRYVLLLFVPIVVSFTQALLFCIVDTEGSMELDAKVQVLLDDYIDLHDSVYISLVSTQLNLKMFFTICSLSMILCYIVNFFCGLKMVAFVQSHADFNPRMKELNRQVTKNLIILAIFPFLFGCCSLLYTLMYYLAPGISVQVQFFYNIMAPWITIINPIVTIWINRPYRDAVKNCIFRILFKKNVVTTISNLI